MAERFKAIRAQIVRDSFKQMTNKWQTHWVIYPLSSSEDINILM